MILINIVCKAECLQLDSFVCRAPIKVGSSHSQGGATSKNPFSGNNIKHTKLFVIHEFGMTTKMTQKQVKVKTKNQISENML